jgi:hypothetical protein
METINELARETPIIHRTEVLVVGSGPGVAAAVSIQTNSDVSAVDIKKVQQTLLKQGARIH